MSFRRSNPLSTPLQNGSVVLGAWLPQTSPEMVEVVGLAGFDFAVLDMEHGPANIESMLELIRAADSVELPSIVRVTQNDPRLILRVLDCGAKGVQVPMIFTADDAQAVVQAAKYHPFGQRGFAPSVRAALYGFFPVDDYIEYTNKQVLSIVQIENLTAVRNLPEILKVEGIDAIFIGPADLSQALGKPGQFDNPMLEQVIDSIISQCTTIGMPVGIVTGTVQGAKRWIEKGVTYLTIASTAVLKEYASLASEIRKGL